jgi:hypothetical protein
VYLNGWYDVKKFEYNENRKGVPHRVYRQIIRFINGEIVERYEITMVDQLLRGKELAGRHKKIFKKLQDSKYPPIFNQQTIEAILLAARLSPASNDNQWIEMTCPQFMYQLL